MDFEDLSEHYGQPKVEINLTKDLMQLIGSFAKHEDPEVAEVLSNLDFVKVRVYELNGEIQHAKATLEEASARLKKEQWNTLVTVNDNEDNQNVRILSKSGDGVIDGFVVMVVSPDRFDGEAVFINIVGDIDPSQIAKITDNLDVDMDVDFSIN